MYKFLIVLLVSCILISIDYYIFLALKSSTTSLNDLPKKIIRILYWSITFISLASFITLQFVNIYMFPKWVINFGFSPLIMLYIAKLFALVILFMGEIWIFSKWSWNKLSTKTEFDASRNQFITQTALLTGALFGGAFIYGIAKGAYNYTIHNKKLTFPNFPKSFDGLKIVQISDLHVGSFVSERPLEKAVALINEQDPDIVLFTGDLVNNIAKEMEQFQHVLSKIKAKKGVFSVLGNHDYGDYVKWDSEEEKSNNLQQLIQIQKDMGWKILIDENATFQNGDEQISIIGIQNWGAKARFPKYGDLKKAHQNTEKSSFKILMSHDPSHWKAEVTKLFKDIDLTFSGHTHGFQFGIEIPGFIQWSPVKYVYKEWAGLYKDGKQYLYVNRGLGFLGYPGRVGISPEITVLELYNS